MSLGLRPRPCLRVALQPLLLLGAQRTHHLHLHLHLRSDSWPHLLARLALLPQLASPHFLLHLGQLGILPHHVSGRL